MMSVKIQLYVVIVAVLHTKESISKQNKKLQSKEFKKITTEITSKKFKL